MWYIYSKNLNTQISTLVSGIILPLVALIFVDNKYQYVFNLEPDNTEEVVVKAQKIIGYVVQNPIIYRGYYEII